jgi:hypothetical protein
MRKILFFVLFLGLSFTIRSQSLTDGIMMDKNYLCAGVLYNHDSWKEYWEGTLLRSNGNIGTLTTQNIIPMANYGITNNLNVIAMLPYVWTGASAGTITGLHGFQDLTVGLKYKAFETGLFGGKFSIQVAGGGSLPVSNYVSDLQPFSIGLHSSTLFGRGILHFAGAHNLSINLSGAYMARGNIKLDRTSYYTTQLIYSNEVKMPDAAQIAFRGGYYSYRWALEALAESNMTLGGFDIRRQDMPFPSNNMDATRIGVTGTYRIPFLADVQIIGTVMQTIAGRNMGKSLTWTAGVTKFFGFGHEEAKK